MSNLANASSLIYHSLASFSEFGTDDSAVNWSGTFGLVSWRRVRRDLRGRIGFYLVSDMFPQPKSSSASTSKSATPTLLLGPFSGRPACQFIRAVRGKGVCADAFVNQASVLVHDVHSYPGHIACDGATRSEIVVPVFAGDSGKIVGVLDLDCLKEGAFEVVDREGLERIAKLLGEGCDW